MTLLTREPVLPLVARLVRGGSEVGFGTYWEVVDQQGQMPLALAMSGDENRLMDEQWCKGAADGWNAASGIPTEGGDMKLAPGESLSSPAREAGDAK